MPEISTPIIGGARIGGSCLLLAVLSVGIKTASGFLAEQAGSQHLTRQVLRPEARLFVVLLIDRFHHRVRYVQALRA